MRRRTRGPSFNRTQVLRLAVVIAAGTALCAAAVGLGRGREAEVRAEPQAASLDPLAAEFRRCNGLGEAALADDACAAAWAEHRRRFFMDRSRPDAPPLPGSETR